MLTDHVVLSYILASKLYQTFEFFARLFSSKFAEIVINDCTLLRTLSNLPCEIVAVNTSSPEM